MNEIRLFILIIASACIHSAAAEPTSDSVALSEYPNLATMQWQHGVASCEADSNPTIQVVRAEVASYILRQNKCITFEAPFIYVLIGEKTVLVVDTGANESPEESPLYQTIRSLISNGSESAGADNKAILVVHSHSHGDHTKGDSQFRGKTNVEVVGTNHQAMIQYFGFSDWPNNPIDIDLGGRSVTLIPTPGHQEQSISIFDDQTGWLLTGDTLYPGLIRVKNWDDYRASIARLVDFSDKHQVSMILGAHIETNAVTKSIYQIGSTYQPDEMPLALNVIHLRELGEKLQKTKKSRKLTFNAFVISPLSRMEKLFIRMMTPNKKDD